MTTLGRNSEKAVATRSARAANGQYSDRDAKSSLHRIMRNQLTEAGREMYYACAMDAVDRHWAEQIELQESGQGNSKKGKF